MELNGPRNLVVNMIILLLVSYYYCTRRLLYPKNAKKTKTEETIGFFATMSSLVAFQQWDGPVPPSGYAYDSDRMI